MSKKVIIIILSILAAILLILASIVIWYNVSLMPAKKGDENKQIVKIEMGSGAADIAKTLKNADVIKSSLAFRIYVKLNNISNFQAGNYEVTKSMSVEDIAKLLQTGKLNDESIAVITFVEGKNMRWIAQKISEETNNTVDDVYALLKDENYINSLIEKYWFITDEIKNKDIYYPLEGYLFPDTYEFEKNVKVQAIFDAMLNQMENKLNPYKEQMQNSKNSVHELLTIASIIENEAVFAKDRKDVASVIYNRLNQNMPIQSDVTTYYAFKIDMGTRDLYLSEINEYNPYNTRGPNMNGKLPVGPISMVSVSSIEAAIALIIHLICSL